MLRVRKKGIVESSLLSILIFNASAREMNLSFFESMWHDISFTSTNYVITKIL